MTVTRDEAIDALNEIDKAGGKISRLRSYRHASIFFVVWGIVWLAANLTTFLDPNLRGAAWMAGVGIGVVVSFVVGNRSQSKLRALGIRGGGPNVGPNYNRNFGITVGIVFGFIACIGLLTQPITPEQTNALISIFFAFLYMFVGVWVGWRLFAIGLVTAVGILVGFYFVRDYFDLWMAAFGGGSLIAAGLWLRSA